MYQIMLNSILLDFIFFIIYICSQAIVLMPGFSTIILAPWGAYPMPGFSTIIVAPWGAYPIVSCTGPVMVPS